MELIEHTLMAIGTLIVLASLVLYHRRTHERVNPVKLVKGEIALNSREFLANRTGLYLLAMGVMIRYVNQPS